MHFGNATVFTVLEPNQKEYINRIIYVWATLIQIVILVIILNYYNWQPILNGNIIPAIHK